MTTSLRPKPARPLPMTVVSGYLGAGKTTLVNSVLSGDHGLRIAVLVNDFGKIAIDETLIGARSGDVIALANGCMCCQIGGDLYDAIDRILRMRERFDHLLVETSGVADPMKVAQIAVAEPELELSRTVVLVDVVNFTSISADPRLNDTLLRQVRSADLILLTKTDIAETASVADLQIMLAELGLSAPVAILQKHDRQALRILEKHGPADFDPIKAGPLRTHHLPFDSWSWTGVEQVDLDSLLAFTGNPALNIYRLKGCFHLTDGRMILLHKVGSNVTFENTDLALEKSQCVAIGAKPDFSSAHLAHAWIETIKRPKEAS